MTSTRSRKAITLLAFVFDVTFLSPSSSTQRRKSLPLHEIMKTSFILSLVCVVFTTISAQPKLDQEPFGCAAPQSPPRCLYSTPAKYFGSCAIYRRGNCLLYCYRLIAPHRKPQFKLCYEVKPRARTLLDISSKCYSSCRSVKSEIRKYKRQGKSDVRALISLVVDEFMNVTAKSFVYEKTSTPLSPLPTNTGVRLGGARSLRPPPPCTCGICSNVRARCPKCCRYLGYVYV